jgi:hypothetical protein
VNEELDPGELKPEDIAPPLPDEPEPPKNDPVPPEDQVTEPEE